MKNKKILIVIGGGISAYKALDLIRLLKKNNFEIKTVLTSGQSYSKEDFLSIFEIHSASSPSFNFALDIALYDILSQGQNISLGKFLNSDALENIEISGTYIKNNPVENKLIKVKLLCQNVDDDINIILDIVEKYDKNILLRLDANRGYDINDAIRLCNSIDLNNPSKKKGES